MLQRCGCSDYCCSDCEDEERERFEDELYRYELTEHPLITVMRNKNKPGEKPEFWI